MSFHGLATMFSLWLTPMTVIASLYVCYLFWPSVKGAAQAHEKGDKSWLLMGIFVGMLGDSIDNLYWAFPWSADFIGASARDVLFSSGVYPNSVFRQGFGVVSSMLHLIGISKGSQGFSPVKKVIVFGALIGFIFVGSLLMLR